MTNPSFEASQPHSASIDPVGPALIHGFKVISEEPAPELGGTVQLLEHEISGATLLRVKNQDENRVFAIGFLSPPEDSSGGTHVLEHMMARGSSKKFPVKEPFATLRNRTDHSSVRAVTDLDRTYYVVASKSPTDHRSQIAVCLDAVFCPDLDRVTFLQHGWRYQIGAEGKFSRTGIVLSEMIGATAEPDRQTYIAVTQALFPDTCYRFVNGGLPAEIPKLTPDRIRELHQRVCSSNNTFMFLWGNDDSDEVLQLMDPYLRENKRGSSPLPIAHQAPFAEPITVRTPVAVKDENTVTQGNSVVVSWCLAEPRDAVESMALAVLNRVLLSRDSSPLNEAIDKAKLGTGRISYGFSGSSTRQPTFMVGVKGVESGSEVQVEALVLDALGQIAQAGIPSEEVTAAIHRLDFSYRENDSGSTPQGMTFFNTAFTAWRNGQDPIGAVRFEPLLRELTRRLTDIPGYLEGLIRERILTNPHRATVILEPDPHIADQERARELQELAELSIDRQEVLADDAAVKQRIAERDSQKALETIPATTKGDLVRVPVRQAVNEITDQGLSLVHAPVFTGGIAYVSAAFDLSHVDPTLLPYLDCLAFNLFSLGTATQDRNKFQRRIVNELGGVNASLTALQIVDRGETLREFALGGKSLYGKVPEMLDILDEALRGVDLDRPDLLERRISNTISNMERSLVRSGHSVCLRRILARFTDYGTIRELTHGLEFLRLWKQIQTDGSSGIERLASNMKQARDAVLASGSPVLGVTAEEDAMPSLHEPLRAYSARYTNTGGLHQRTNLDGFQIPKYEGLVIGADVNSLVKGYVVPDHMGEVSASSRVVVRYLGDYLMQKVVGSGRAYTASFYADPENRIFAGWSYKDATIADTLAEFDRIADHLQTVEIPQSEIDSLIVACITAFDAHMLPSSKGATAISAHRRGSTPELRQARRDQILGTTLEDFRILGAQLADFAEKGAVSVLGKRAALEAFARSTSEPMEINNAT